MMAKKSKVAKTAIAAVTASAVFLCGMGAGSGTLFRFRCTARKIRVFSAKGTQAKNLLL